MVNIYRGVKYLHRKWRYADLSLNVVPITEQQAHNLIDLADLLRKTPPPVFDMVEFANVEDTNRVRKLLATANVSNFRMTKPRTIRILGQQSAHDCGTSCCAVGTAAFFGIGEPERFDDWVSYSNDTFGTHDNRAFQFLFGSVWSDVDNTAEGAAARILCALNPNFDLNKIWERSFFSMMPLYQPFLDVKIGPKE